MTFARDEAAATLDLLFSDVPGRLSLAAAFRARGGMAYTACDTPDAALDWAARHADRDDVTGIYIRQTTLVAAEDMAGRRGLDIDSHALGHLWSDLDFGTEGHKPPAGGLPLPPDLPAALGIVNGLPHPTMVIHSGGGAYALWKLAEPILITEHNRAHVAAISQGWQELLGRRAAQQGYHYGTGVGDLARVLRLPGTMNRKAATPRPCTVLFKTGELHDWDTLATLGQPQTSTPVAVTAPGFSLTSTTTAANVLERLADVCDWADILEPAGWTRVRSTDAAQGWLRPGGTHAVSAKVLRENEHVLVVHSEDAGLPTGAGQRLTKGRVYAHLHHAGDLSAASIGLLDGTSPGLTGLPARFRAALSEQRAARIAERETTPNTSTPTTQPTAKHPQEIDADVEPEVQAPTEHYDPTDIADAHLGERVARGYLRGTFLAWGNRGWHQWIGKKWERTTDTLARRRVRDALLDVHAAELALADQARDKRLDKARAATSDAERKAIIDAATRAHAERSKALKVLTTAGKIESVLKIARGFITCNLDDFDRNPDILNVNNGIVDLRTGQLTPHDPAQMCSRISTADYVPDATHPDWAKTLAAMPLDVADWMQVRFGQGATGHATADDIVPFLKGGGANGKSTVLTGIHKALGEYATVVPDKVLLGSARDHTTELMTLYGARIAFLEELPEGDYLDAQRLKKVAGTEQMIARFIGEDNIQWQATHSLMVTTNYDVKVATTDHGTWRRLALVAFPYTYDGTDPDRPKDATLRFRVRDNPEIHTAALAWLVAGAVRWYANHRAIPEAPRSVRDDTDRWRIGANDTLEFLDEHFELDGRSAVLSADVYRMFQAWQQARGKKPLSDQTFWERARQHVWFTSGDCEKKVSRTSGWNVDRGTWGKPALPSTARLVTGVRLGPVGTEQIGRLAS